VIIFNQNYFCSIPLQNILFASYLDYYLALFGTYALEKGYQLSPNLPKKFFGISKSTSLSPSSSMKYEDPMKVVRKMKHHCPQD
jgi:hypothetical protein